MEMTLWTTSSKLVPQRKKEGKRDERVNTHSQPFLLDFCLFLTFCGHFASKLRSELRSCALQLPGPGGDTCRTPRQRSPS
jgi:hypothetical protein